MDIEELLGGGKPTISNVFKSLLLLSNSVGNLQILQNLNACTCTQRHKIIVYFYSTTSVKPIL